MATTGQGHPKRALLGKDGHRAGEVRGDDEVAAPGRSAGQHHVPLDLTLADGDDLLDAGSDASHSETPVATPHAYLGGPGAPGSFHAPQADSQAGGGPGRAQCEAAAVEPAR